MTKYRFLDRLREVIPRRIYQVWEVPVFGTWYYFAPFWPVADWCADWLQNIAGGRMFQLLVVAIRITLQHP